jgi:hypothetical protein
MCVGRSRVWCLAGEREARLRNAGEVASAVHTIRVEVEERTRQAELDRVRAELNAVEQHKRRRVQLALFGVTLLLVVVLCGIGFEAALAEHRQKQLVELEKQQLRELGLIKLQSRRLGERFGGWIRSI